MIYELIQTLVSFGLMVLIWIVQIVHYPIFYYLEEKTFSISMKYHQKHISMVVVPLMTIEMLVTILLLIKEQSFINSLFLILASIIWCVTFILIVPIHKRLLEKKRAEDINYLVKFNWTRTFIWTTKFIFCWFYM